MDFRMHFKEMDRLMAKNDSQSKYKLKLMVFDAIKFQQRIIELSILLVIFSIILLIYSTQ